jgi:hypothetical protein
MHPTNRIARWLHVDVGTEPVTTSAPPLRTHRLAVILWPPNWASEARGPDKRHPPPSTCTDDGYASAEAAAR